MNFAEQSNCYWVTVEISNPYCRQIPLELYKKIPVHLEGACYEYTGIFTAYSVADLVESFNLLMQKMGHHRGSWAIVNVFPAKEAEFNEAFGIAEAEAAQKENAGRIGASGVGTTIAAVSSL